MKLFVVLALSFVACALGLPVEEPISPSFDALRDVRFLLQNHANRNNPVEIHLGNLTSVTQSVFRRDLPIRMSTHGWNGNANDGTHHSIARVLLDRDNFNFIFIDWGLGAQTINYVAARNRVSEVGAVVGALLDWLNENDLCDFHRVTIVGFSLGAHVAGFAGKSTRRGKVNTIIGMDPAGPLFNVNVPSERLASGDAEYVEAIHTDGVGVSSTGIGAAIADADFFPNGGTNQPGCTTGGCNHGRAVAFYMESVGFNNRLRATRCASVDHALSGNCGLQPEAYLGGEPSNYGRTLRGIYHLTTNSASPFGQG